jgi:hypothetical protein
MLVLDEPGPLLPSRHMIHVVAIITALPGQHTATLDAFKANVPEV